MSTTDTALVSAHDVVEAGLAVPGGAGRVVLVRDSSDAELRFANNTTTTNGVRRTRSVTVISIEEVRGGVAAGSATRSGVVDVADLVRTARDAAASAPVSDDASALIPGTTDHDFSYPAVETDLSVLSTVLGGLPGAFERAANRDVVLAGFVEHGVVTTYLGTSSGSHRRHVQPTGSLELTARAEGGRGSWAKVGTADFAGVTLEQTEDELARRLEWSARSVELPAGRHPVVLPPAAVADFMTMLYGYAGGGQDAEDGTTVFSKAGGGTRVGDRLGELAFELRSDPAEPGIECIPFLATEASGASTSVFDNGLPLERTQWIADGRLAALQYHRAGAQRSGVAAALADLALVHPNGRPHESPAHRPHARRGLPHRGWTCVRRGQQLQVQREPRRPARTRDAGRRIHQDGLAGEWRVPQPDDHGAAQDPGLQHELGEPRKLTSRVQSSRA